MVSAASFSMSALELHTVSTLPATNFAKLGRLMPKELKVGELKWLIKWSVCLIYSERYIPKKIVGPQTTFQKV